MYVRFYISTYMYICIFQAYNCYRKAAEISPHQILAWQGMANFLEKQAPSNELAEVYGKLLELDKYNKKLNKT